MPHVSDVRSTSHDRHDPMLVAALAADDLAGTDRDQAIALTRTCSDCAALHDDLIALARATAAAPPPIATRPRDFRLTPADAARLRPSGWRRLVAAFSTSRSVVTRPLGVGLATLGLVGLLIGNVSIGLGGSAASAPGPMSAASGAVVDTGRNAAGGASEFDAAKGASAAPSSATVAAQPVASQAVSLGPAQAPERQSLGAGPSGLPGAQGGVPLAPPGFGSAAPSAQPESAVTGTLDATSSQPLRPLNLLFGAAIVLGVALIVASLRRGRRSA